MHGRLVATPVDTGNRCSLCNSNYHRLEITEVALESRAKFADWRRTNFDPFAIVDVITWRVPFRSLWNYFAINILSGKAAKYGILPFDAFWEYFANVWSMALVPLVLLVVRGSRHKLPLILAALAIFLTHSIVAHKEYRFDYPVVVILIMLAAIGIASVISSVKSGTLSRAGAKSASLGRVFWPGLQ